LQQKCRNPFFFVRAVGTLELGRSACLVEAAQRRFVATVNTPLRNSAVELRQSDTDGGYPVFGVVGTHSAATACPKNLIFT
jgi:hypothetical protein